DAVQVRARNNPKWTVGGSAVVKMYSNGDQALKQRNWCMNEQCALLYRPAAKLGVSNSVCDGNTEILVNRNEPVEGSRLLEGRALDGDRRCRQQCRDRLVCTEQRHTRSTPRLR